MKGRSLDVMSAIKRSIVVVKTALICLAYALIIAMARVNGDRKYKSYSSGEGLKKPVEDLLKASGVDVTTGEGFQELRQFQDHLSDYLLIVFDGVKPDRLMFRGNSRSAKKLHLLCDRDNEHYNVITNMNCAMAKQYIFNTLYDFKHKCLFPATPPCTKDQTKYFITCNTWFLCEKCFPNHLTLKVKGKLVCQWKQVYRSCSSSFVSYS